MAMPEMDIARGLREIPHSYEAEQAVLGSLLLDNEHLLGIDVCGEFPIMKSLFDEKRATDMDSLANEVILDTVEEHVQTQQVPL